MKKKRRLILIIIVAYILIILIILAVVLIMKSKEPTQTLAGDITQTKPIEIEQNSGHIQTLTPSPSVSSSKSETPTETMTQTQVKTQTNTFTLTSSQFFTSTAQALPDISSTPTPTSSFTPTASFTPTITNTPTPNPGKVWEGNWTGYFGMELQSVYETSLTISVTGNQVLGSAIFQGGVTTFDGTFSDDYHLVVGTWSCPPAGGNFTWLLLEKNQFTGNRDNLFAYCGSRNGDPMPEPCFGP
jgi:hypothetical protein